MKGKRLLILGAAFALGLSACANSATMVRKNPLRAGEPTESVDFSAQGYTNQQAIESYAGTDFSVEFNKGTNSNAPKYYTSGSAIRAYGGNYFVVSSSTKVFTQIVLTFGSSDGSNAITTDVATYTNGTWSGEAESVKFSIGGTSGNRRIAGLAITFKNDGGSSSSSSSSEPEKELNELLFREDMTKTDYYVGDDWDYSGVEILATYKDGSREFLGTVNELIGSGMLSVTAEPANASSAEVTSFVLNGTYGNDSISVYPRTFHVSVTAAADATFEYGTDNSSTSVLKKAGVELTIGTPGTDGTWEVNSNNAYKVFKNKTLVVSGGTRKIDKIEFTCTASGNSQYGPGCFTTDSGYSYEDTIGTWIGSATSVTFTASSNQVRMTKIYVHFESTDPYISLDKEEVKLFTNQSDGIKVLAAAHNIETPTFSWSSNNANVTLENASTAEVTIKPNVTSASSSTVTVTVGGVTPAITATVSVSIVVAGPGETAETAYYVAQAIEAIDDNGGETISNVFVRGIISRVEYYDNDHHSLSYWISDDGTTDDFKVYSGKGINGANFNSLEDLEVGANVVIFGDIKLYTPTNGNDPVYQFNLNSRLITYTLPVKVLASIAVSGQITSFEVGNDFLFGGVVTASYEDGSTKDVTELATFSGYDKTTQGNQTITVSYTENEVEKTATYTVTVIKAVTKYNFTWNLSIDETVVANADQLKWSNDYAQMVADKADATTDANNYYPGKEGQSYTSTRFYKGSTLTIKPLNGYAIASVEFTATTEGYATALKNSQWTNASASVSEKVVTVTPTNGTLEFVATIGATTGHSSVKVVYSKTPKVYLNSASSLSNIEGFGTETIIVRFGASIAKADWDAINEDWTISDYGVMLVKKTTLEDTYGLDSIEEAYKAGKNLANVHKGSGTAPHLDGDNYLFSARINISGNYDVIYCAAPYIVAGGQYYFLPQVQGSVNSLGNNA